VLIGTKKGTLDLVEQEGILKFTARAKKEHQMFYQLTCAGIIQAIALKRLSAKKVRPSEQSIE